MQLFNMFSLMFILSKLNKSKTIKKSINKTQKRKYITSQKEIVGDVIKNLQKSIVDSVDIDQFTQKNIIIPKLNVYPGMNDLHALKKMGVLNETQVNDINELDTIIESKFPIKESTYTIMELYYQLIKQYDAPINNRTPYDNALLVIDKLQDTRQERRIELLIKYNPTIRTHNVHLAALFCNILIKINGDKNKIHQLTQIIKQNKHIFNANDKLVRGIELDHNDKDFLLLILQTIFYSIVCFFGLIIFIGIVDYFRS